MTFIVIWSAKIVDSDELWGGPFSPGIIAGLFCDARCLYLQKDDLRGNCLDDTHAFTGWPVLLHCLYGVIDCYDNRLW